jgi:hypothetical protein
MAKVYDTATDLITFARGSSATYTGSDGTQQTAASDEPRIEYAADGTLKGLLIEEQRTNLLLNSDNPDTQVASLAAGSHTLSFVGGPSVTGISDSITANAVDVFVYDTSKDSDGGAWRTGSLAQASSWYAEASSPTRDPNTRSTRAEFPAVAVIVAEAGKVTIYDGDDPSLPMWMVFLPTFLAGGKDWWRQGRSASCVAAMEGTVCIGKGAGGSYDGLSYLNFPDDSAGRYYRFGNHGTISPLTAVVDTEVSGSLPEIVDTTVNDVAMTVLPDAPTDPVTGLPVPTIAVATDGGVSVIKDDGTVVDSSDTFEFKTVDIDDDILFFTRAAGSTAGAPFFVEMPITSDGFSATKYRSNSASGGIPVMKGYPDKVVIGADESDLYTGSVSGSSYTGGVTHLAHRSDDYLKSMVAYTTSTYTTGWMNGDIKLAALADTTAETFGDAVSGATVSDPNGDGVYDGELVANGGFATNDLTSWDDISLGTGTVDASSGSAVLSYTDSNNRGRIQQSITHNAGATLSITFTVSGSRDAYLSVMSESYVAGAGTHTFTVNPSLSNRVIFIQPAASGSGDLTIDNISVRLADPDRSVNGNGLAVHGSITKAPVATGADVVAYSGFSASNYLEQPYNPDLDFADGDFCVMGWVKATIATQSIFDRGAGPSGLALELFSDGFLVKTGTTYVVPNIDFNIANGMWRHVAAVRRNGVLSLVLDGVEKYSAVNDRDVSSPNAVSRIGVRVDGSRPAENIALLRISATAPTADQIAKIYNDERPLFQPNAKATLTGNSDAVTALAHDPDTNLLHVGTSGGRSVFYGLRRVNETATAVTTAISAVDGLIVEQ